MTRDTMARRDFVRGAVYAAAATVIKGQAAGQTPVASGGEIQRSSGTIPQKALGKTGVMVSALGVGGFHLGTAKDQAEATAIVGKAIDAGVNFFDNAWEYHEGESENRLGKALQGKRDKVVLMTKVCTHGRGKDVAMRMLEDSLRRLKTDHLDVWQIHEVVYYDDPELIFTSGGAVEALTLAKQQGKVRFVGFTGHKDPAIHLENAFVRFFRSTRSRCRSIALTRRSTVSRNRCCPRRRSGALPCWE